jgi:hypothetical protein
MGQDDHDMEFMERAARRNLVVDFDEEVAELGALEVSDSKQRQIR